VTYPRPTQSDNQLRFLRDLEQESASIAGDVFLVGDHQWAIHGFIPVDGDVLMAEFDSYDEATNILHQLPGRARRPGESSR
jgi:hypothetical protein